MIDQNIKEGDLVLIQGTFNGPVYNDREDIYSVILHGGREVVVRDIFLSPPTTGEIVKALKDGHAVETWTGEYWRDFGSLNYWEMLLEINSIDTSTYQYGHRVVKKHEP